MWGRGPREPESPAPGPMNRLLALAPFVLISTAASAQTTSFTGVSGEVVSYQSLDGATRAVVRLYAELSDPSESLYVQYTSNNGPATVLETTDPQGFWQAPFGGNTSLAINPAVVDIHPETAYDSYLTIGAPDASGGNGLLEVGMEWDGWNTGGSLSWTDGGVFQLPDTVWTYPVEGRVLLAQVTVTAGEVVSGRFSLDSRIGVGNSFSHTDVPFSVDTGLVGIPHCSDDAAAGPCPCGNAATPGAGCANSSGVGASLTGFGSPSVATDTFGLSAGGLLPGKPALLFSGTALVNGGAGALLGDGLRCAGGQIRRLGVRIPDAAGGTSWVGGIAAELGLSGGETRYFQVWYRDVVSSPCGNAFSLSSALELTVEP